MRELTGPDIEDLVARPGVRSIGVERSPGSTCGLTEVEIPRHPDSACCHSPAIDIPGKGAA